MAGRQLESGGDATEPATPGQEAVGDRQWRNTYDGVVSQQRTGDHDDDGAANYDDDGRTAGIWGDELFVDAAGYVGVRD